MGIQPRELLAQLLSEFESANGERDAEDKADTNSDSYDDNDKDDESDSEDSDDFPPPLQEDDSDEVCHLVVDTQPS